LTFIFLYLLSSSSVKTYIARESIASSTRRIAWRSWLPALLAVGVACSATSTPFDALHLAPVCGETLRETAFSSDPPGDVEGGLTRSPAGPVQRAVDVFAWRSFVSAQWAQGAGVLPAWRTWMRTEAIFRRDSAGVALPPSTWGAAADADPCGGGRVVVWDTAHVSNFLDESLQPTGSDDTLPLTLTSRTGDLVRYEVRFNKVAYDSVVSAHLWDGAQHVAIDDVTLAPGSTVVKAAWVRVPRERAAQFYTEDLCVCDGPPESGTATCAPQKMGLVAFHMKIKTPSAPQWIWTTFEHAANVAPLGELAPTFFDPSCANCTPNVQRPAGESNQITRVLPISQKSPDCTNPGDASSDVVALNVAASNVLRSTREPWLANMQLIGAQWTLPPSSTSTRNALVFPAPALLGNTSLESYIQDSSSCVGCHAMARTLRVDRTIAADFLFSLSHAGSAPPETQLVAAPACPPVNGGPSDDSVCRGQQYASRTYELLPEFVGAKLHCSSCHLDTGRRRGAAWWAGSIPRVDPPNDVGIVGRINRCFTNSMNGKELCKADPSNPRACLSPSAPMNDLIAYIEWVTQSAKKQGIANFDDGFPPISAAVGDEGRGASIYLQKCASCHGTDGQGRYDHGYFKPSLWGSTSFNQAAGLFSAPSDLAAFIRWNMPLGSGGILTDQEAWDLESLLHSKPRPQLAP
jgi:cytochrome c